MHSECLTGEAFGSLKCECGPQLDASLEMIDRLGGVVIYMRGHEGRGIGLVKKLKAYRLQEDGRDTLDANLDLGLPADDREAAAQSERAGKELTASHLLFANADRRDRDAQEWYFVRQNRPVPRFLMLDQPSQAHFQGDLSASADGYADCEGERVRAMFRVVANFAEAHAGAMQVIMIDHARYTDEWFTSHVRYDWHGGEKLVPDSWMQYARKSENDEGEPQQSLPPL